MWFHIPLDEEGFPNGANAEGLVQLLRELVAEELAKLGVSRR